MTKVIPMTRTLNNWATATAAAMVLALSLGLTTTFDSAAARPAFMKLEGVPGEATDNASNSHPKRTASPRIKSARGTACCSLPRKGGLKLLKPLECRKLKGTVVPQSECPQAGAKASDAYFVKVDRETTTQNSAAEMETTQSGDDEAEDSVR